MNDLASHKDDAERDRRLDWFAWHVHESQSSGCERNAVSNRERSDGSDELAPSFHQNEQGEHEQQMVDAEKNVLDTEHKIGAAHFQRTGRGCYHKRRRRWGNTSYLSCAIQIFNPHQHVGHGGGETGI